MSDFEFLRNVTIGQYLPTGSPIHRRDPRARLLGGACLVLAITIAPRLAGLGLAVVALLGLLALARIPLRYALRGLLPPLPLILLLALLQMLFGPQVDDLPLLLDLGPARLTLASLRIGGMLVLRFGALILTLSLLSFCLSTREMIHALTALLRPLTALGLPTHDFIMMVQIALRFLPLLALEAEHIAKAQASRGAEWGVGRGGLWKRTRQALPLLIPLFLNSLHRAENLALAMEARGYNGGKTRTSMTDLHFRWGDALALLIVAGLTALILLI